MTTGDSIGWLAAALTLVTFSMRSMIALRIAALSANVRFTTYGVLSKLYPVVALHPLLFPCDLFRLCQLCPPGQTLRPHRAEHRQQGALSDSALLTCLLLVAASCSGGHAATLRGFAEGYSHSASLVCHFREGPMLGGIDLRLLDPGANLLGTRRFFVALSLYGRPYACADALSAYGPRGVIRPGLLEEPARSSGIKDAP